MRFKEKTKLLFPFYTHSLIFNLSKVIMPYWVLYFLNIGFTFFQIALISGIRSVVSLVFEIPTGVIADKYGRKKSVILGYLLTAVSLCLIPVWDKFYIIAIIFAFDALFETLVSGADTAWPVELIEGSDKSLMDKYFLRIRMFRNIGMVIAPIIGAYIVSVSTMKNLWLVFAIGIIVSTIILCFAKEIKKHERTENIASKNHIQNLIHGSKKIIQSVFKNKFVLLIFLGIFAFYFIDEITSLVWTPYIQKSGINLPQIGYLFSIISAIGIILPIIAGFLLKKKSKLFILFVVTITYAIILFVAGNISSVLLIALLFVLFSSIDDIFLPLEDSLTNEFIKEDRAAILSAKSMVTSLASIIGAPVAGLLLGLISQKQALSLSGLLILVLPIIYFSIRQMKKNSALK